MSDIVERLRYWGADDDGWLLIDEGAAEVCSQAADEIERLNAENARLREALHQIAHAPYGKVYCRDGHEEAVLIARAALGEKEEK